MKKILIMSQWVPFVGIAAAMVFYNDKNSVIERFFWTSCIYQGISTTGVIVLILHLFGVV